MLTYLRRPKERGMTLIELIIFLVVVGVALAGLMSVIAYVIRTSADPVAQKQALAIAESLQEEVAMMPFTFCDQSDTAWTTAKAEGDCATPVTLNLAQTLAPGSSRAGFDHVYDYYSNGGFVLNSPITDISGTFAFPAGYAATITIVPETSLGGSTYSNNSLLRITVEVTGPLNTLVRLDSYRTRHWGNFE